MKSVIYAAKSTKDVHLSIPEQVDDCREMCAENGWEIVGEFFDENFTAFTGNRGPDLAAAIQLAKDTAATGEEVMLVAQHTSRFARGNGNAPGAPKALVELWHEWARCKVRGRLVENDLAMASSSAAAAQGEADHNESKRKSKSVTKGLRRRARDRGLPNGGPRPFGYRWGEEGTLVIDPAEAEVIKRIHADYLAGKGQRQIARDLNTEFIKPLRGASWHQGTITNYLSNPLYAGRIRLNDDVYDGQHEAIIDPATWDKVDQLRRSLRRTSGKNAGRYPTGSHLFRKGHLRCGRCGEAMQAVTKPTRTPGRLYEVYACYGRNRHGTASCGQAPIQRRLIDTAVWEFFARVALDVEATKQAVVERSSAKLAEIAALLDQAERDLARAEDRLTRVRRAFQDGKLDADDWREQRAELTAALEAARAHVQRLQAQAQAEDGRVAQMDAEDSVLRELTAIRSLVAGEVQDGRRDGLDAFRATLRRLFDRFDLVQWPMFPKGDTPQAAVIFQGDGAMIERDGQPPYLLIPYVRPEAIDEHSDEPVFPAMKRTALALSDSGADGLGR
jgi:site-specific DNA recombinase